MQIFITVKLLYMLRASIAPIIRRAENCSCSLWYRSYYLGEGGASFLKHDRIRTDLVPYGPNQSLFGGPEGSRKLSFPDFMTTAQDSGLSALRTGRLYPRKYSWYSFLLETESTPGP